MDKNLVQIIREITHEQTCATMKNKNVKMVVPFALFLMFFQVISCEIIAAIVLVIMIALVSWKIQADDLVEKTNLELRSACTGRSDHDMHGNRIMLQQQSTCSKCCEHANSMLTAGVDYQVGAWTAGVWCNNYNESKKIEILKEKPASKSNCP